MRDRSIDRSALSRGPSLHCTSERECLSDVSADSRGAPRGGHCAAVYRAAIVAGCASSRGLGYY